MGRARGEHPKMYTYIENKMFTKIVDQAEMKRMGQKIL